MFVRVWSAAVRLQFAAAVVAAVPASRLPSTTRMRSRRSELCLRAELAHARCAVLLLKREFMFTRQRAPPRMRLPRGVRAQDRDQEATGFWSLLFVSL